MRFTDFYRMTTPGSSACYPSDVINIGNGTAQKKEYRSIKERGPSFYTFREGGSEKRRPWSNLLTIEYLVVSYTPLESRSRFLVILRVGGSSFSTFGGWGYRNRRLWSSSLISEVPVVSYTSQVEIAVSSYLQVISRGPSFFGCWALGLRFLPTRVMSADISMIFLGPLSLRREIRRVINKTQAVPLRAAIYVSTKTKSARINGSRLIIYLLSLLTLEVRKLLLTPADVTHLSRRSAISLSSHSYKESFSSAPYKS